MTETRQEIHRTAGHRRIGGAEYIAIGMHVLMGDPRPLLDLLNGTSTKFRWQDGALCRQVGPDMFYPVKESNGLTTAEPKSVCASCPVREECLTDALENPGHGAGEQGIWGGTSPEERKNLLRWFKGDVPAAVRYAMAHDPRHGVLRRPQKAAA